MGKPATLTVKIAGDNRGGRSAIAETDRDLGRLGRTGQALGGLLAAGAGAGIAALGLLAGKAFEAASAAEQASGAVDAVFGKSAAQMHANAKAAADSVGLSAAAYEQMSAVLGAGLKNAGVDDFAGKTDKLVRLGADLAAQYGGSTADAVEALGSLLRGERDPIERFGVSMNQAAIDAQKQAMGLDGLTGAAAKNADIQATLALLNKQTADAQGASAREADTAAGAQQRLSAKFDDLMAKLGEGLLPVFVDVVEFIEEKILPAVDSFMESAGEGGLGGIIGQLGDFFTDTLVPAFEAAYDFIVEYVVPALSNWLGPAIEGIAGFWETVTGAIEENYDTFEPIIAWMRDTVAPFVGEVLAEDFRILGDVIGGTISTIANVIEWVASLTEDIRNALEQMKLLDENGSEHAWKKVGTKVGGSADVTEWASRQAALAASGFTSGAYVIGGGGQVVYRAGDTSVTVLLDGEALRGVVEDVVVEHDSASARSLTYGTRF